ncbi:MAG: 10 kDa chaperonin 1 [Candidatus Omnitrophica bacterium]|nr:10 kDa chaperonin 1 [Candidatus Omnitrophota bacterium]
MEKAKIQPLGDRVLVEPLDAEEKTAGGIVIPDTAKEKQQKGKIVAVGKGRTSEDGKVTPLEVKINDQVIYGRYSGTEIKVGANDYLILKEDDILAIIKA